LRLSASALSCVLLLTMPGLANSGSLHLESLHFNWLPDTGIFLGYHFNRPMELAVHWRKDPPRQSDVVDSAMERLGMPYLYGGIGPDGYDCSGLMVKVFAENGYGLPRVSRDMAKVGLKVSPGELEPGDLLFFSARPGSKRIDHVGMYIGENDFVHAASGLGEVTISSLSASYYKSRLVTARRVIGLPPGILDPDLDPMKDKRRGSRLPGPLDGAVIGFEPPRGTMAEAGKTPVLNNSTQRERPVRPWYVPLKINRYREIEFSLPLPLRQAGFLGLGTGVLFEDHQVFLGITPRLKIVVPHLALEICLAYTLGLDLSGKDAGEPTWNNRSKDWRYYLGVLDQLEIGRAGSSFHLALKRSNELTLGRGFLVHGLTPYLASSQVPGWDVYDTPLSLEMEARLFLSGGRRDKTNRKTPLGMQLFLDDVSSPRIIGGRLFLDPGSGMPGGLGLDVSVAADLDAPYLEGLTNPARTKIVAAGLGISIDLFTSRQFDMAAFIDSGSLIGPRTIGAGGALGVEMSAMISGRKLHRFSTRLEARVHDAAFVPSYFDGMYYFQAIKTGSVLEPESLKGYGLPKIVAVERRSGGPSAVGIAALFGYSISQRIELGLYYEDAWFLANSFYEGLGTKSLGVSFRARYLRIPGTRMLTDLYLSYQSRNFENFGQTIHLGQGKSIVSALFDLGLLKNLRLKAAIMAGPGCSGPAPGLCKVFVQGVIELAWEMLL